MACCFSGDPTIDRPVPGIVVARIPHSQRLRNLERKTRRQEWQPALLHRYLSGVRLRTRQSYSHAVPEVEGSVVPPTSRDRSDREVSPPRELACDEATNQIGVDGDFRR